MNKQTTPVRPATQRQLLENKYSSARLNLLLLIAFTAINLILALCSSGTYFLFSATIPYVLVLFGMTLCGRMPEEYYDPGVEYEFFDVSLLVVLTVVAFLMLALYLVAYLLSSKRHSLWLVVATVFFSIDTVVMLLFYGIQVDALLDYVFHALVLYYLISGLVAARKLKKLPPDEEPLPFPLEETSPEAVPTEMVPEESIEEKTSEMTDETNQE